MPAIFFCFFEYISFMKLYAALILGLYQQKLRIRIFAQATVTVTV